MTDLKTTFMGLELKNPVIAGASGRTARTDSIKRLEDAGVAAVVTKSLFEEEIQLERFKYEEDLDKNNNRNPEMITVHPHPEYAGPEEHLAWLGRTREAVGIPVIASLNAVNRETWLDYAAKIEQTARDLPVGLYACALRASFDESGTDRSECSDDVVSGRQAHPPGNPGRAGDPVRHG